MSERAAVAHLTDEELLEAVTEAAAKMTEAMELARLARLSYESAVTDAMIRDGILQSRVAEAAALKKRALFDITSREFDRRQAEQSDQ